MAAPRTMRLDQLLLERGLVPSRARAQALILAGQVLVDEVKRDKAGMQVPIEAVIRLLGHDHPYVSRGGLKMAHALETFGYDPAGQRVLDIGASTGGFTDCLLQRGAVHVTTVDVGTNQLAWSLRQDPRVTVHEQLNARTLTAEAIGLEPVDLIVMDVSFISQRLIIPVLPALLKVGGSVFALIKPQFEAGPADVGAKGVVRDEAVRARTVTEICDAYRASGFVVQGTCESDPPGPEGNVEFFVWAVKG